MLVSTNEGEWKTSLYEESKEWKGSGSKEEGDGLHGSFSLPESEGFSLDFIKPLPWTTEQIRNKFLSRLA